MKSLFFAIAVLGAISVASAAIIGQYTCLPPNAAALTPEVGSFYVTLAENGAITLSNIEFLDSAGAPCATPSVVDITGNVLTNGGTGQMEYFTTQVLTQAEATGTLPCGISVAVSPAIGYDLTFVTKSLVNGFSALEDKKFIINCASFTTNSGTTAAAGLTITGVLVDGAQAARVPIGLSIRIESDATTPGTFATYVTGVQLAVTTQIRVIVELDTSINSVLLFHVDSLEITQTNPADSASRSLILSSLTSGSISCPAPVAGLLSMITTEPPFTYAPLAGNLITATSQAFDIPLLFRNEELASGTTPPMIVTATVTFCGTGCATTDVCTPAGRKRRAVEPTADGITDKTSLFATLQFSTDPNFISKTNSAVSGYDTPQSEQMNNMGYLIGMIVLAALLVLSVAVIVFMFSRMNRSRSECPKA